MGAGAPRAQARRVAHVWEEGGHFAAQAGCARGSPIRAEIGDLWTNFGKTRRSWTDRFGPPIRPIFVCQISGISGQLCPIPNKHRTIFDRFRANLAGFRQISFSTKFCRIRPTSTGFDKPRMTSAISRCISAKLGQYGPTLDTNWPTSAKNDRFRGALTGTSIQGSTVAGPKTAVEGSDLGPLLITDMRAAYAGPDRGGREPRAQLAEALQGKASAETHFVALAPMLASVSTLADASVYVGELEQLVLRQCRYLSEFQGPRALAGSGASHWVVRRIAEVLEEPQPTERTRHAIPPVSLRIGCSLVGHYCGTPRRTHRRGMQNSDRAAERCSIFGGGRGADGSARRARPRYQGALQLAVSGLHDLPGPHVRKGIGAPQSLFFFGPSVLGRPFSCRTPAAVSPGPVLIQFVCLDMVHVLFLLSAMFDVW